METIWSYFHIYILFKSCFQRQKLRNCVCGQVTSHKGTIDVIHKYAFIIEYFLTTLYYHEYWINN